MSKRERLNRNFLTLVKELEKKGILRGLTSFGLLADKIGIDPNQLESYLKGSKEISFSEAYRFIKCYGIAEDRIFKGISDPIEEIIREGTLSPIADVRGGYNLPQMIKESVEFVTKPNAGNKARFKVIGTSMLPNYPEGKIVEGRKLENRSDIKDGKVYIVVITDELPRIKRFYKEKETRFRLVSDNSEFEDDFVDFRTYPTGQVYEVSPQIGTNITKNVSNKDKLFRINTMISENKIDEVCQLLMKHLGVRFNVPAVILRDFREIQEDYQMRSLPKIKKKEREAELVDRLYSFLRGLKEKDLEEIEAE